MPKGPGRDTEESDLEVPRRVLKHRRVRGVLRLHDGPNRPGVDLYEVHT